jgi:hypothetical protein
MADFLRFDFPELPVSVNKLYTHARGRKILTTKGTRYRNSFITKQGGVPTADLIAFAPDVEGYYDLHIWCFLPYEDLYSLGYGRDKRTKHIFKTLDVSNYFKLAEDCISALADVNDRNNWSIHAHKREAHDGEHRLVAILKPLNLEEDPYELGR